MKVSICDLHRSEESFRQNTTRPDLGRTTQPRSTRAICGNHRHKDVTTKIRSTSGTLAPFLCYLECTKVLKTQHTSLKHSTQLVHIYKIMQELLILFADNVTLAGGERQRVANFQEVYGKRKDILEDHGRTVS